MLFLAALQLTVLFVFNCTKSEHILGFDSAMGIRHAVEMWKNHSIFLDNWMNVSTLEIDSAAFFAAPVYLLTRNLPLSLGIMHALFSLIFAAVIFDIYHNLGRKTWEGALAVFLVFAPYSIEVGAANNLEYSNMLFVGGGQYGFRVISVMLLIDLLICRRCRKRAVLLLPYLFFVFWSSLSMGSYVLLMGILPVGIELFFEYIWMEKKLKDMKYELMLMLASVLIVAAAIAVRNAHLIGAPAQSSLRLVKAKNLIRNIENCLVGIFMLVHGVILSSNTLLISLEGILYLLRGGIAFLCISLPLAVCFKYRKILQCRAVRFAFFLAGVNLFVLMITNTNYGSYIFETRYHILWFTVVLMLCPLLLGSILQILNKRRFSSAVLSLLTAAVIFVSAAGYAYNFPAVNDYYTKGSDLDKAAAGAGVSVIFMFGDIQMSSMIQALDPDMLCLNIVHNSDNGLYYAEILDFYRDAASGERLSGGNILAIAKKDFKTLPRKVRKSYSLLTTYLDLNLYIADDNPWKFGNGQ